MTLDELKLFPKKAQEIIISNGYWTKQILFFRLRKLIIKIEWETDCNYVPTGKEE